MKTSQYQNINAEKEARHKDLADVKRILEGFTPKESIKLNQADILKKILPPAELARTDVFKEAIEMKSRKEFEDVFAIIKNYKNIQDAKGMTYLMHAFNSNFYYAVDKLLKEGADANLLNVSGEKAIKIGFNRILERINNHPLLSQNNPISEEKIYYSIKDVIPENSALREIVGYFNIKIFSDFFLEQLVENKLYLENTYKFFPNITKMDYVLKSLNNAQKDMFWVIKGICKKLPEDSMFNNEVIWNNLWKYLQPSHHKGQINILPECISEDIEQVIIGEDEINSSDNIG